MHITHPMPVLGGRRLGHRAAQGTPVDACYGLSTQRLCHRYSGTLISWLRSLWLPCSAQVRPQSVRLHPTNCGSRPDSLYVFLRWDTWQSACIREGPTLAFFDALLEPCAPSSSSSSSSSSSLSSPASSSGRLCLPMGPLFALDLGSSPLSASLSAS